MASSTSSLHYLSLTTQTLSLSKPNTSFSKLSFPFSLSSLKLSLSSTSSKPLFNSRFLRTVAISSEQVEDVFDSEEDDEEPEERSYAAPSPDAKLFVGNLPFSVDSATLAGLFEQTGNVEMVEVIYDKITGRSRGFAFVTMGSAQEAEAAVEQFNNYELDGRPLRVNCGPPPPKRESPYGSRDGGSSYGSRDRGSSYGGGSRDGGSSYGGGSRDGGSYGTSRGGGGSSYGGARGGGSSSFGNSNRVYVGNLSWGVDDSALATLFSESGNVVEAKVVYDRESGRSRGFGFVTYNSSDEVNSAIESLDGADLDGRSIRVSPAEARQKREF